MGTVHAATSVSVGWNTPTTTAGYIQPNLITNLINGVNPSVQATYFTAASTTATSSLPNISSLNIFSNNSTSTASDINIYAGNALGSSGAQSGSVNINGGNATGISGFAGGNINITAGQVRNNSGSVNISAANYIGSNSMGGNVTITAGNSGGYAQGGAVYINDGGSTGMGGSGGIIMNDTTTAPCFNNTIGGACITSGGGGSSVGSARDIQFASTSAGKFDGTSNATVDTLGDATFLGTITTGSNINSFYNSNYFSLNQESNGISLNGTGDINITHGYGGHMYLNGLFSPADLHVYGSIEGNQNTLDDGSGNASIYQNLTVNTSNSALIPSFAVNDSTGNNVFWVGFYGPGTVGTKNTELDDGTGQSHLGNFNLTVDSIGEIFGPGYSFYSSGGGFLSNGAITFDGIGDTIGLSNTVTGVYSEGSSPTGMILDFYQPLSTSTPTMGRLSLSGATSTFDFFINGWNTTNIAQIGTTTSYFTSKLSVGTTTSHASGLTVSKGDVYVAATTTSAVSGIILTDSGGACHRIVVSSLNVITASTVTCP